MIHQELKQLLDFAIQKGEITEKDKEILHRKGIALGQDVDELDMFIEAEVHKLKKAPSAMPNISKKIRKYKKVVLVCLSLATLLFAGITGVFLYRNSLIEKALTQFKSTGHFDNESLENARNLSSEYSAALLGYSYFRDADSLAANNIFITLRNSSDWRVIALSNQFFNETNQINVVQKGLEEEVSKEDWFWCQMKAVFLIRKFNGYEYDKNSALLLYKKAADEGSSYSMFYYAQNTDDKNDKYTYYQKVINRVVKQMINFFLIMRQNPQSWAPPMESICWVWLMKTAGVLLSILTTLSLIIHKRLRRVLLKLFTRLHYAISAVSA